MGVQHREPDPVSTVPRGAGHPQGVIAKRKAPELIAQNTHRLHQGEIGLEVRPSCRNQKAEGTIQSTQRTRELGTRHRHVHIHGSVQLGRISVHVANRKCSPQTVGKGGWGSRCVKGHRVDQLWVEERKGAAEMVGVEQLDAIQQECRLISGSSPDIEDGKHVGVCNHSRELPDHFGDISHSARRELNVSSCQLPSTGPFRRRNGKFCPLHRTKRQPTDDDSLSSGFAGRDVARRTDRLQCNLDVQFLTTQDLNRPQLDPVIRMEHHQLNRALGNVLENKASLGIGVIDPIALSHRDNGPSDGLPSHGTRHRPSDNSDRLCRPARPGIERHQKDNESQDPRKAARLLNSAYARHRRALLA